MPDESADCGTAASGRTHELIYDDVHWGVRELAPTVYDRRLTLRLIFESDGAVRVVRAFPSDWRSLTPVELMRVSWNR